MSCFIWSLTNLVLDGRETWELEHAWILWIFYQNWQPIKISSNLVNWHQVLFVQFWWMQTLLASDIRINHCTAICLQDKSQVIFHLETFFCCSLSPFESQTTNTKDLWQYDGLQTASRLRDRCFQPKSRFYFYLFPNEN